MIVELNADFMTFNQQMIDKHGKQYTKQADLFFERAVMLAQKGLLHTAFEEAKFALALNGFSKKQTRRHYIIGFISQLLCDLGQLKPAKTYYELGLKLLDNADLDYWADFEMYQRLKEHIDSEGWKE